MKKDKEPKIEVAVEPATEAPEATPGPRPAIGQIVPHEPVADVSVPMIGGISTDQLRAALAVQTEQRDLIKQFIQSHLVEGTDYGQIHVVSRDKCPDQDRCKKLYHFSKAVLFKPGQEKLFSLFQITDKLERDVETYEMLPNIANLVAYKCVLYRADKEIGQGRGSAVVGDNRRDANATIKIAEKRARMDACLSLGFSEYFAQDLDDPDYKSHAEMANQRVAAQAEMRDKDEFGLFPRDATQPVNDQERSILGRLLLKLGFSDQDEMLELLRVNGIEDPKTMTSGQARDLMRKLSKSTFAAPPKREPAPTGADLGLPNMPTVPAPTVKEEELVVDDDLKIHVAEQYDTLGLNARGQMWFKKFVSGKPFGKLEDFTDEHWRKAFQFTQDILNGVVDVDDAYIAGLLGDAEVQQPINFSEPATEEDSDL